MNNGSLPTEKDIALPQILSDDFELADHSAVLKETDSIGSTFHKHRMGILFKNKGAAAGLAGILIILLLSAVGPLLSSYTYDQQIIENQNLAPRIPVVEELGIFDGTEVIYGIHGKIRQNGYTAPSEQGRLLDTYYWFGSDVLGRDIFTRTCVGTRISLYIALVAVLADLFFGVGYGLISGYFGKTVDYLMQRFAEVLNGIPTLVIVTLLIVWLKPGIGTITLALSLTGWIGMSRVARAQVLKMKEQEFVLAAKTLGASHFCLIFKEILPNIIGQLLIMSMFSVPNAIFTEAFLAFIGLGVPAPLASLGTLISEAFQSFTTHPYMIVFPLIILGGVMLGFNLLADGLRDIFGQKMKGW